MLKSVLDTSVWTRNSSTWTSMLPEPGWFLTTDWVRPSWACRRSSSEANGVLCNQGHSRPPTAPRVPSFEHENLDTSAGHAKPGKPPSPVMSRARGGAFVVVGARESRAHGEGRQ
jgi:hypothetical protein